jgi:hypothetical protein
LLFQIVTNSIKLLLPYSKTWLDKAGIANQGKYSSLLKTFARFEENKVLWIQPQETLYFMSVVLWVEKNSIGCLGWKGSAVAWYNKMSSSFKSSLLLKNYLQDTQTLQLNPIWNYYKSN